MTAYTAYAVEPVLRRLGIDAVKRGRRLWAQCPRAKVAEYHATGDRDASWMIWSNDVPEKAGPS